MSLVKLPTKLIHSYSPITINSETLKDIAQKLATTHLFIGTSELDRLTHKQLLLLTAAGFKPVSQVAAGHWQDTSDGRVSVPDDVDQVKSLLEGCGLVYHIRPDMYALDVLVARNPKNLHKMFTSTNEYEIGRLFGYPETATLASKSRKQVCLSLEEQEAILRHHYQDQRLINLFCFRMSKQHYLLEMRTVEFWFSLLAEFNLLG